MRIVWANGPFLTSFDLTDEETVGSSLSELGSKQWADLALKTSLEAAAMSGQVFRDVPIRVSAPDSGGKLMKVSGNRIPASQDTPLILLSIHEADSSRRARSR